MKALAFLEVPTTMCPTTHIKFPPTRNHLRPRRSVFAPLVFIRDPNKQGILLESRNLRYHETDSNRQCPCWDEPNNS